MKKQDKAYVIINSSQMQLTLDAFGHNEKISNKFLIIGGGNIGFNLAKNLENSMDAARIKIVEKNKERAELIANNLNNSLVINGNGLDEDVLKCLKQYSSLDLLNHQFLMNFVKVNN